MASSIKSVTLWRISNYPTLDGLGGLQVAGRWHSKGRPIAYCSANPSTALLENLVHLEIEAEDLPEHFQVLKVEAPASLSRRTLDPSRLPNDWPGNLPATQAIGDEWLTRSQSLLLEVPSALVPETWNILVNPLHPEVSRLRIAQIYQHPFDPRLLL